MDRLLRDLLQCSPYTPPPMLSPVREGSGLYFNAVCSSTAAEPCRLLGSVLGKGQCWGCARTAPEQHRGTRGSGAASSALLCLPWGFGGCGVGRPGPAGPSSGHGFVKGVQM